MNAPAAGRYVGQRVLRVEDDRILTGTGRYVDDIRLPGMLHAAFVRSPIPHGTLRDVNVEAALAAPGVVAVFAGPDVARLGRPLQLKSALEGYQRPVFHALATDRVLYVGDPIAVVIAESRYLAEDARDAVLVDLEPLPPVATMDRAVDPEVPPLFDGLTSNILFEEQTSFGDPETAFAQADLVVRETYRCSRVSHVPMEPRGGIARFERGTGELEYEAGTQSPHLLQMLLADALGHPLHQLRVRAPDIGGAFGQKAGMWREDVVVCLAARELGRPVKWTEDRVENLMSAGHAREEDLEVAAAVKADGTILALDVRMTLDQGAYPALPLPTPLFLTIVKLLCPGPYRIGSLRWHGRVVATNKAAYAAYRGPWAAESLLREAIIDRVARELGLDPIDVRRRNLVTAAEQPTRIVTGPSLVDVTARETLDRAVEVVDYRGFRHAQEQARALGRLPGIGFATFIEPAPGPPEWGALTGSPRQPEPAVARLELGGFITVYTAQVPHGQGHATTLAQVAADAFGVALGRVRVVHGDTRFSPFSLIGTGGSRAATMASGATIDAVRTLKHKVLSLAAAQLEISVEDLEFVDDMVQPLGAPSRGVPLAEVARLAHFATPAGEEPGLRSAGAFTEPEGGWAQATHCCCVEIDPGTGEIAITRYLVVHDCGDLIHPAIVEGQIRGGVAQGIGQALLEKAAYADDGTFQASTFLDYLVPTATDVPHIEIAHVESRPHNEVNFRGVGEGGAIVSVPAIVNAVEDALGPAGGRINELPITPQRIAQILDERHGVDAS